MPRTLYTLSEQDLKILYLVKDGPFKDENGRLLGGASYFTTYAIRQAGQERGWMFDDNITKPWQLAYYHDPRQDYCVVGGFGCLAGDAPIYDPTTGKETPVADLAAAGKPIWVLSWTGSEFVAVKAASPYRKGKAKLYRVTLEDGRSIVATAEHAFLTPTGYRKLGELSVGSQIGVLATPDQTTHGADAARYPQTLPGYPDGYWSCPRPDDAPLPLEVERVLAFAPLSDDALAHIHSSQLDGARAGTQERTRSCRYGDRPSKRRSARRAARRVPSVQPSGAQDSAEHARNLLPQWPRLSPRNPGPLPPFDGWSLEMDRAGWPASVSGSYRVELVRRDSAGDTGRWRLTYPADWPHYATSPAPQTGLPGVLSSASSSPALFDLFQASQTSFAGENYKSKVAYLRTKSIEEIGEADYYDLHVPILNNYVAGGMVHHNSGKTIVVAMAVVTRAFVTRDYKFLCVAPSAFQAEQMYREILQWTAGTLFEKRFLWKANLKPYPKLTIKYKVPDHVAPSGEKVKAHTVTSTLEFMSLNENAGHIRTWQGDEICIEQAELVDNLRETMINLRTRLRGKIKGRERLGRMTLLANADDNPELWEVYDEGEQYPNTNLSIRISTYDNKNLTQTQIEAFERSMGGDRRKIEQYMNAGRPLGKGEEFARELVEGCIDHGLDALMESMIAAAQPGFEIVEGHGGLIYWAMPPDMSRQYVVVGDPGQGKPPLRNAPVVMVFDVTDYPQGPIVLRAFWWGDGGGAYTPWIEQMTGWMDQYRALNGGYDATGGQKVHSELSFANYPSIWGVDLSNMKKRSYMVTIKLVMQKKLLRLPANINGLTSQLLKYKLPDEKIAQDIVSALFVLGGCLWFMGYTGDEEAMERESNMLTLDAAPAGRDRTARPVVDRTQRSGWRRVPA